VRNKTFGMSFIARIDRNGPTRNGYLRDNGIIQLTPGIASILHSLFPCQCMGKGTFYDPRLNDAGQFPIASCAEFGNVRNDPDSITPSSRPFTSIS
jgi:hypothetical protein